MEGLKGVLIGGKLCRGSIIWEGSSICHSRLEDGDIVHCHSFLLSYLRQKSILIANEGKKTCLAR